MLKIFLVAEVDLNDDFFRFKEFFGKFGSFVGRVSFTAKNVQIDSVRVVGKMAGDERGFDELGHREARHARIFAKIYDDCLSKSFHFYQFTKFMHELCNFFRAGQGLVVAAIQVDASAHAPRIDFFVPLDDFLVFRHFAFLVRIFLSVPDKKIISNLNYIGCARLRKGSYGWPIFAMILGIFWKSLIKTSRIEPLYKAAAG